MSQGYRPSSSFRVQKTAHLLPQLAVLTVLGSCSCHLRCNLLPAGSESSSQLAELHVSKTLVSQRHASGQEALQ